MFWVRIDNRLVHGQVIETWLPYTRARSLLVVNDDLSSDPVRQEIMSLAVPDNIDISFSTVKESPQLFSSTYSHNLSSLFILFAGCLDAKTAFKHGLLFNSLNIGNIHYGPGKKQICAHIALSPDDSRCLHYFFSCGIRLDFRCVPHKKVQVETW